MQHNIGVLGLGVHSTNFYVNQLHKDYHQLKQGYSTFPFLLYQIDFNSLNPYLPNQFEKLIPQLQKYMLELEKLPVKKWIIPNITLHETFDKLNSKIDVIHPIKVISNFCNLKSINSVVIFGTKYTMKSEYLYSELSKNNIKIIQPEEKDMIFIDELRTKIYQDKNTSDDLSAYKKLVEKYTKKYYILIACTELSIISSTINTNKLMDIAKLQIQEAINFQQIKT